MTIATTKGYGVELEYYKGIYSLRLDREYNDKFYWVKCKLVYGRDEELAEKSTPVKIVLGDKKRAREVLEKLLDKLCDDKKDDDEESIPF